MNKEVRKKRELLVLINSAIVALNNMAPEAAKLEVVDNDVASRLLKQKVLDFRKNELNQIIIAVKKMRTEILNRPKRNYSRKEGDPFAFLKNQQ